MNNKSIKILKDFEKESGIHFCSDHYGKMKGLFSINTSPLDNELCSLRAKKAVSAEELEEYPIVCRECYSRRYFRFRTTNNVRGIANGQILNSKLFEVTEWPKIQKQDFPFGRIEAFGDTKSWIQQANYFQLAKRNPRIQFGDWTKNPWFITEAIDHGFEPPQNVEIVLSSLHENKPDDPLKYPFIKKVFTVYSLAWLLKNKKNQEFINCGGRSCLKCGKCYLPVDSQDPNVKIIDDRPILYINEIRKQDQRKALNMGWDLE